MEQYNLKQLLEENKRLNEENAFMRSLINKKKESVNQRVISMKIGETLRFNANEYIAYSSAKCRAKYVLAPEIPMYMEDKHFNEGYFEVTRIA